VNQTIRNLQAFEPYFDLVDQPAQTLIAIVPVSHGVGCYSHLVTEAVALPWHDDLPAYYKGRWLLRQRNTRDNLIRESTDTFPCAKLASYAHWYPDPEDPIEWEAWVAPIWASTGGVL